MRCLLLAIFACVIALCGCMDDLHNYHECVDIETARCDLREDCLKKNNPDTKKSYPDFDHDTCIAYTKEHCRTREIGNDFKGDKDIEKCVQAIMAFPCADLRKGNDETEALPACEFINVPEEDGGAEDETTPVDEGTLDAGSG